MVFDVYNIALEINTLHHKLLPLPPSNKLPTDIPTYQVVGTYPNLGYFHENVQRHPNKTPTASFV